MMGRLTARTLAVAKGGWVCSRTKRVRMSAAAPARSRKDAVICVMAKMRRRWLLPEVERLPLVLRLKLREASAEGRRGTKARQTAAMRGRAIPNQTRLKSRLRPSARGEKRAA